MATVNWSLQHKHDTAANLAAWNGVLKVGQLGIETDNLTTTPKFKIGDGTTAWNSLPYFYGGALSAQDLQNVLSVGNSSGNLSAKFGTGSIYWGASNQTHIQYTTGLELHNTTANTDCLLSDSGLWKVNATQYMPNLTASRLLSLDSNKNVVNETGTGFLKLSAGVISYDTNTYLTTISGLNISLLTNDSGYITSSALSPYLTSANAALTYQPLDADLTSWAGVTRASGFDTFVAAPSSANLSSLLTDKTGGGVNVFGTSPTFTTDITTPLIIGGSAVGSNITYKSTSGTGTTTAAAHTFTGGANGGATIATLYNDGQFLVGTTTRNPTALGVLRIGQGTSFADFGERSAGLFGLWMNQTASPTISNYTIIGSSSDTYVNTPSTLYLNTGGNARITIVLSSTSFTSGAVNTGAITPYTFTVPANTGQTASTEIPNFKVTGASKTWANGGGATTIATQRWNWFSANTAATSGGGSLTITDSFGTYFEAATASGVTITNNWAIGTNGGIKVNATANTVLGNAALATNATSGFLYIPSCAGTPTGVPTTFTGTTAMVYDTTNNKLYVYNGAWKSVTLA